MTAQSLLFVRVPAVEKAIEGEWTQWYDREHFAYRLDKPGFLGARRYRVDDGPTPHLALYELADPSALTSEPYLAHRRWEEAQQAPRFEAIAPRLPGFRRGVYRQAAPSARPYAPPDCAWMLIVDLDGADAVGTPAQRDELVATLEAVDGVGAARVLDLTTASTPGTGQHTGGPQRLAMIDTADIGAPLVDAVAKAWSPGQRPDLARASMRARRAYSSFHPTLS